MNSYQNRKIDLTKKIDLYRCLNRKGFVFSIRQKGLVVAHTDKIVLKDCELIVNKKSKRRAIKSKNRNVHAFVRGFIGSIEDINTSFSFLLNYKVFSKKGFYILENQQIDKAKTVYISNNKVYCQI